jgi:ribonuclease VapC
MTVVDTSIVVELMLQPDHQDSLLKALHAAAPLTMSSFSVYKASVVVLARLGREGVTELQALLRSLRIEIVDFTPEHANAAVNVYAQFGKGFHPAKLNLGDCPVYVLARQLDATVMFKGDDFSQTDLPRTIHPF